MKTEKVTLNEKGDDLVDWVEPDSTIDLSKFVIIGQPPED